MADSVAILVKLVDGASGPARAIQASLRGVQAAGRAASGAGMRLTDSFAGLAGGVALGGVAAGAITAVGGAAKDAAVAVVGLVASFGKAAVAASSFGQQQRMAMGMLLGSASAGSAAFDQVRATAARLGLDVHTTTDQFRELLAMQFKVGDAMDIVKMGADMRALGSSAQKVESTIRAITQIKGKGFVQMEELQQQLGEAGIAVPLVIKELAKARGKTEQEIRKLISAGKIGAEEGVAAIQKAVMAKLGIAKLGDAGGKWADSTMEGMKGKLLGGAANLMIELGKKIEKPLGDALGPIAKDFLAFMGSDSAKAAVQGIADAFGVVLGAVGAAWPLVKQFIGGFLEGLGPLKEMVSGVADVLGPALKSLGIEAGTAAGAARLLGQGLAVVVAGALFVGAVIAGAVAVIGGMTAGVIAAAVAFGALGVAAFEQVSRFFSFVSQIASSAWSLGTSLIDGLVNGIVSGASRVIEAVKSVATSAITTAATVLKIGSPSKVFEELGGFATSGFERGIEAGTGGVITASAQMASGSAAGAAGGLGGLGGGGLTVNMPVTIDGAGKTAPEIVDELQRTFLANLGAAFRQLQVEAGA